MQWDSTARRRRLGAAVAALGLVASGLLSLHSLPASGAPGDINLYAGTGVGHYLRSTGDLVRFGSTLFVSEPPDNAVLAYDLDHGTASWYAGIAQASGAYSGDGGPATSARLDGPEGMAVDGSGNLFIADTVNNVVRRVDVSSHIITTIAGTGTSGYTGDSGLATSAQLHGPRELAINGAGDLFICDWQNRVIRRVDHATQNITTYAGDGTVNFADGGAATATGLDNPIGIAVDGSGNLYIADMSHFRVRRVDAGTGNISTVAGVGTQGHTGDGGAATAAELEFPHGLAFDGSGNLYIADEHSRVRRVDAGSGNISTVAGDGSTVYNGDGLLATSTALTRPNGLAFDASGNLLVSDSFTDLVRRVDAGSGIMTTVLGGFFDVGDGGPATGAYLPSPYDTAVGSDGSLYVADVEISTVKKIATNGTITTVAGSGNRSVDVSFGDGGPATLAWMTNPTGIAIDASENLYVYDAGNCRIRKVDHNSGVITTVVGNGTCGYNGDGHVATATQLGTGYDIEFDPSGRLVIADSGDNRVLRVELDNTVTTLAGDGTSNVNGDGGPAASAAVRYPVNLAYDLDGNLFISELQSSIVRRVDAGTGNISTFMGTVDTPGSSGDGGAPGSALLRMPAGLAFDGDGNLFVAEFGGARVRRVDAGTHLVSTLAGTGVAGDTGDGGQAGAAQLNGPAGLVVDTSGNLIVSEVLGGRLRTITAVGRPRVTTTTTTASTSTAASTTTGATTTASTSTTVSAPPETSSGAPSPGATNASAPGTPPAPTGASRPATLPVTGANLVVPIWVGGTSIVAGLVIAFGGRRRRTRHMLG